MVVKIMQNQPSFNMHQSKMLSSGNGLVKQERVDDIFAQINQPHQPQPPPQRQHRQTTVNQGGNPPKQNSNGQYGVSKKPVTQDKTVDIESLPDFPSIKGMFGWTTIDDVNVPYILRSDKQFVSVRIVEMKLLSRYPNSYPDDLGKHAPLTSFFVTENEAKLLNEINSIHCNYDYGKKEFNTKDLIVLLTDFIKFFELVKKTFPDARSARAEHQHQQKAGWLQIKNTVTPYLSREDGKYVPLSVIQYAAGLLTNERVNSVSPTKRECDELNNACKQAGVEFTFSVGNKLIKIKDLLRINPVEIIALPSSNPLKHATYMELPTKNSSNKDQKTSAAPTQKTQQPYRFQPNPNLDLSCLQGKKQANHPPKAPTKDISDRYSDKDARGYRTLANPERVVNEQSDRIAREQSERATREQVSYLPHMNMQGLPMFSPPMAAMYRHPLGLPQFMPQNPHPHHNPLAQYYLNLQQQQRQGPPNQQAPPGGVIPGRDHARSPGSSSSTNPSPRSRPPSASRPPSGSRPPSQPPASPLSPTQLSGRNPGFGTHAEAPLQSHGGLPPPPYPGMNMHQIQAMFAQRLPFHFPQGMQGVPQPPPAHKQPVSSQHNPSNGMVNGNVPQSLMASSQVTHSHVSASLPGNLPNHINPNAKPKQQHPTNSPGKTDAQKSPVKAQGVTVGGPPPLILMTPTDHLNVGPKNGLSFPDHVVNKPSVDKVQKSALPVTKELNLNMDSMSDITTPVQPQPLSVTTAKQKSPYVDKIQGAWLNNKSISCLELTGKDRQGRYCLVEAVCKLYFNGCSVNEFLFALEKVLNVPLLTCNDDEEKAFIQYYNLPVDVLKCNKMIKFDDLETFFPQLSYMFPDKNATDALLGQEAGDSFVSDNNNMDKLSGNGVVTADLEDSMPMTMAEMGMKRQQSDMIESDPLRKKLRIEDTEDETVIILD